MSGPRREMSAYFLHEADTRRTADVLDVLFEHSVILRSDPSCGRPWLLTIVLPDNPSLSTFYVDDRLLAMVEELVESNGGALWDGIVDESAATDREPDDEPGLGGER